MFWVISVYFNIGNTLQKSGTFLLGHSVEDRLFATLQRTLFIRLINKHISLSDICLPVHYITSCNTQSSAPEDGQNNCPKYVELTGIINKPLLFHLVGCLYYLYFIIFF